MSAAQLLPSPVESFVFTCCPLPSAAQTFTLVSSDTWMMLAFAVHNLASRQKKPKCSPPAQSMLRGFLRLRRTTLILLSRAYEETGKMAALLDRVTTHKTGCHHFQEERKADVTVTLAPVRSVHTDVPLSKTLLLWSTIYPRTLLHKKSLQWFSYSKQNIWHITVVRVNIFSRDSKNVDAVENIKKSQMQRFAHRHVSGITHLSQSFVATIFLEMNKQVFKVDWHYIYCL